MGVCEPGSELSSDTLEYARDLILHFPPSRPVRNKVAQVPQATVFRYRSLNGCLNPGLWKLVKIMSAL